ncbi:MAG: DUF5723 family protein [Bacteroidia bacterium]
MKTGLSAKRKFIVLICLSILALIGKAQSNLALYHSKDQISSPSVNPAFLTDQKKFTFSIFPLSGMSVGYNDQQAVKSMLKDFLSGTLDTAALKSVFNSLIKEDLFFQRFETSLISFGYNSAIGSFNFQINEIEQIRTSLKGNITEFMTKPAIQTVALNQPQVFTADMVHYREYSLGYAREIIKNKLSVGVRAKIYFGKASLVPDVPIEISGKNNTYYFGTSGPIKTSIPVKFVLDKDTIITGATPSKNFSALNYLFNKQNMGVGVDLGFSYQINSKIELSASIVDLGKINWNSNLNTINLKGQYEILPKYALPPKPGNNFIAKSDSFLINDADFNQLFKSRIDSTSNYSTKMPTSFYAGLQYQIDPLLQIGVVDRFVWSKGMSQNSISLTANYTVNKKFTLISGYSSIGKSYYNIPFAVIYYWSGGQSFLGTDNLLLFLMPQKTDYAGISFGTCFYLFRPKVKYKQSEYLPFYKEKKHNTVN